MAENILHTKSGVELIQDEYTLQTPDLEFIAGMRGHPNGEFGGYTSFGFDGVLLDDYLEVVNSGRVETLSFTYGIDCREKTIIINIDKIEDLLKIGRLFFKLKTKALISLDQQRWGDFHLLNEISLKGTFAPDNFPLENIAHRLGIFETSFEIFEKIYTRLDRLQTLRLIESDKKWVGNEFNIVKNLKRLHFDTCSIKTLDMIAPLKEIKILVLAGCRSLNDMSILPKMKSLEHLVISECRNIKDWDFLRDMPWLKSVSLTKSIDATIISDMPNLRFLYIENPKKGEMQIWCKNPQDKVFGKVTGFDMQTLVNEGVIL